MSKYKVSVEKRMYATGCIEVEANSAKEAEHKVIRMINNGELQTSMIQWGDPQYEDCSFGITGDTTEV